MDVLARTRGSKEALELMRAVDAGELRVAATALPSEFTDVLGVLGVARERVDATLCAMVRPLVLDWQGLDGGEMSAVAALAREAEK